MKKRFLSLIIALAMMVGVFTPLLSSAKPEAGTPVGPTADTETTTKVTIHKIKVKSTEGFPLEQKEGANEIVGKDNTSKYDGGKIGKDKTGEEYKKAITDFFGAGSEELANVVFTYWVFDDEQAYKDMVADPSAFDTVEEVKAKLKAVQNVETDDVTTTTNGVAIPKITVPANGHKYVWAVEKSKTITDAEGKQQTITEAKAVPFGLALPLFKANGTVNEDIHVYPKNTTANEPKVDKDFEGKANAEKEREEITNNIVEDAYVGQEKKYDIETIIPAGAKYKTVAWTDQMTEGLTFNNNVKIMIGAKGAETEWDAANYTVTPDGNGFVLELTKAGLAALEEKAKDANVRLLVKYSATVNENAKVERQERNDVIFHYGNDPHHGNTPYPTKPSDGSLKVNKEFTGAEGDWKDGEKVTVTIYDAHTGKPVKFTDGQEATVELTKGTKTEHTWTGLDNDRQYIVKEKFTAGDEVTYVEQKDDHGKRANGSIKIIDKKTDNPTPKDPEEPGVETYGKKFVKADKNDGTRLAGAEFVIKNEKGKFLALKETQAIEKKAYDGAQTAYIDAINAWNKAVKENNEKEADKKLGDDKIEVTIGGTKITGKTEVEKKIAELKKARDDAFDALNTQWKWADTEGEALKFTSDQQGKFEVTGLAKGTYTLREVKAPAGYALPSNQDVDTFDVAKGTYASHKDGVTYSDTKSVNTEGQKPEAQRVNNKKVTIPQTGGIGTVIFTAIGLAIMASAIIAIKKRQATEAR